MIDRRSFLGATLGATAAALGARPAAGATPGQERKILRASDRQVLEGDRPVRLRGVNLGGWMLIEDYMIGLPWTEWKIREQFRRVLGDAAADAFFGAWAESYVTDAVGALLQGTDVEPDTREQWAREVRRDFDAPALDFILRRLKGRSAGELAAMARSFVFESCDVHEDQLGMLRPFLKPA